MSKPTITVALCTYNPRLDYLERTLEGVRKQTLSRDRWEFILIDNNSQSPLEGRVNLTGLPQARIVVEKEPGLSHARRRAFEESKGEVTVNLDDDAILDHDYLEKTAMLIAKYPFIGVFGCALRPEFETTPAWPIEDYYGAQRTIPQDIWSNIREHFESTPAGAGSVVRKEVANAFVSKMRAGKRWGMLGRTADQLFSCEDIEIAMVACDLGLGKGLFKDLKLTHLIPSKKMTVEFQCRNSYGNGYSAVFHNFFRFHTVPQKPTLFGKLFRYYRLLAMKPYKRSAEIAKDQGIRDAIRAISKINNSSALKP